MRDFGGPIGRRAVLATAAAGLATPALAQPRPANFPGRPIRVFGAWAPGPNIYTRVLADLIAPRLASPS